MNRSTLPISAVAGRGGAAGLTPCHRSAVLPPTSSRQAARGGRDRFVRNLLDLLDGLQRARAGGGANVAVGSHPRYGASNLLMDNDLESGRVRAKLARPFGTAPPGQATATPT